MSEHDEEPLARSNKWLLWGFHVLYGAAALWLVYESSYPNVNLEFILPGFALAFITVTGLGVFLATRGMGRKGILPGAWVWVAPAIVAVMLVLTATGTAARIRWELSQSDFEAYVAAAPTSIDNASRIGHFDVRSVTVVDGAVIFHLENQYTFNSGIVYAPEDIADPFLAENGYDARMTRIEGDWYWLGD